MKTDMQSTSLTAYQNLTSKLPSKRQQVYNVIRTYSRSNRLNGAWATGVTNQEIKFLLGWEICSVTGRTNSLVKDGLVRPQQKRRCRVHPESEAIAWEAV